MGVPVDAYRIRRPPGRGSLGGVTISFPVLLLIAGLVGVAVAALRRSPGGSGTQGGPAWWSEDHLPWGGADEPFHPRDRDLRERAWEEAEAEHRRSRMAERGARMDERYGGDFDP